MTGIEESAAIGVASLFALGCAILKYGPSRKNENGNSQKGTGTNSRGPGGLPPSDYVTSLFCNERHQNTIKVLDELKKDMKGDLEGLYEKMNEVSGKVNKICGYLEKE